MDRWEISIPCTLGSRLLMNIVTDTTVTHDDHSSLSLDQWLPWQCASASNSTPLRSNSPTTYRGVSKQSVTEHFESLGAGDGRTDAFS
jgi:hypothetical protein